MSSWSLSTFFHVPSTLWYVMNFVSPLSYQGFSSNGDFTCPAKGPSDSKLDFPVLCCLSIRQKKLTGWCRPIQSFGELEWATIARYGRQCKHFNSLDVPLSSKPSMMSNTCTIKFGSTMTNQMVRLPDKLSLRIDIYGFSSIIALLLLTDDAFRKPISTLPRPLTTYWR